MCKNADWDGNTDGEGNDNGEGNTDGEGNADGNGNDDGDGRFEKCCDPPCIRQDLQWKAGDIYQDRSTRSIHFCFQMPTVGNKIITYFTKL